MSSSSSDITLASLGTDAGYPNLNVASVPEKIREGGSKAMQAYAEGISFEGVLVNELSQQLSQNMFGGQGLDGSTGSDGLGDSSGGSSGSGGMLSAASAYSSLIPQTLTSSIMDSGGLGMAAQFAQELDPSLADAATPSTTPTGGQSTTDSAAGAATTSPGAAAASAGSGGAEVAA